MSRTTILFGGGEGSRTLDKELMSLLLWPLSYPASTVPIILRFQKTVNKYNEKLAKRIKKPPNKRFCSGPSEIRTHDLLNAIETRSQLRYRPIMWLFASGPTKKGGPGGIRTPDLFSAIEARSQLRYRPPFPEDLIILCLSAFSVK